MSQIALKTPFSDSFIPWRDSKDTYRCPYVALKNDRCRPFFVKNPTFWEKPLFNEKPWYFSYRNFMASRPLFLEAEAHKVCKIYLFYLNFSKIEFSSAWNALLHLFFALERCSSCTFQAVLGDKIAKISIFRLNFKWQKMAPRCPKLL